MDLENQTGTKCFTQLFQELESAGEFGPGRVEKVKRSMAVFNQLMNLFVRHVGKACIAVVCLMPLLTGCATKGSASPASLNGLIEGIEKKAYIVNQFRAKFVKTRHSTVFNRDLSIQGYLVFQKPNRFWLSMSGDVTAEILSDGRIITLIHDQSDREVFRVEGDRDLSKFADPMVLIMQGIGNGSLRKFAIVKNTREGDANVLEVEPGHDASFERIKRVSLSFSDFAEMTRVTIDFKNGDRDETVFQSWSLLARDDPEILQLNKRLEGTGKPSNIGSPGDSATHAAVEMMDRNPANFVRMGTSLE